MKYLEPKINVTYFDSLIKTEGAPQTTMAPVSANYNTATYSLYEKFEGAAEQAQDILVFKW